jgi:hypothetical protein
MARSVFEYMNKTDAPSYQNAAFRAQLAQLAQVNDCFEGTDAIRAGGTAYLPQFPAENSQSYKARLNQSVFFNAFKRTIQGLTGLVFRKNPVVGDDADAEIKAHLENIDNQGSHLDVFAKEVFEAGVRDGHTYIFVDMPQSVLVTNEKATRADEKKASIRPYWVHYLKSQVINWRTETINGQEILTQATICESVIEPNGEYEEMEVDRFRVLKIGQYQVFENKKEDSKSDDNWVIVEEGTTSLDFIPLLAFYANKEGYFTSCPPLKDLSDENLRHYRLQSDLDNILHVCNVPILTAVGRANPDEALTISNSVVDVPIEGDLKYTEHSGSAIAKAQEEIKTSEARMAALGLMLLSQQPKQVMTATESIYKTQAELSTLSGMARSLQDALEMAGMFHAAYLGKSPFSIQVNQKFAAMGIDPQKISAYTEQVKAGILTLETMWQMLVMAEELPDTFDAEKEKAALCISPIQAQTIKLLTDSGASIHSAAMAAGCAKGQADMLQMTDMPTGIER